ncbi:hypothetical protein D3C76_1080090 [compost metagenome]
MDRQANGAGLVHDRPLDGLANPPGRIGREPETTLRVELLDSTDQPQVALLDQVEQRQAAVHVTTGNFDNQAQVAFDHALAAGGVAFLRQARKMHFLLRRQQRREADFVEVQLGSIKCPSVIDVLVLLERRAGLGPGPNRRYSRFV